MIERVTAAGKIFLTVAIVRFLLALVVEKLFFVTVVARDQMVFSCFVALISAPIGSVVSWSYLKRAAWSLTLLFVVNMVFILIQVIASPRRSAQIPGYMMWVGVDLVATLLAWLLVRNLDRKAEPVAPADAP